MKPVYQTRFGEEGNCFEACLASLLEIPLEDVPDLKNCIKPVEWIDTVNKWLVSEHGLYVLFAETDAYNDDAPEYELGMYIDLEETSLRGNYYHARIKRAGKVLHDPNRLNPEALLDIEFWCGYRVFLAKVFA